jgi:hypothetical protein
MFILMPLVVCVVPGVWILGSSPRMTKEARAAYHSDDDACRAA